MAVPGYPADEPAAAVQETAEPTAAAEEDRGLGWLLELSGLGAVTGLGPIEAEPDPAPVSPAAPEPVSAVPEDAPVSGAEPGRTDWFAPTTETGLVVPGNRQATGTPVEESAEPETPVDGTGPDTQDPETSEPAAREIPDQEPAAEVQPAPAPAALREVAEEPEPREQTVQEQAASEPAVQGPPAEDPATQEEAAAQPPATQEPPALEPPAMAPAASEAVAQETVDEGRAFQEMVSLDEADRDEINSDPVDQDTHAQVFVAGERVPGSADQDAAVEDTLSAESSVGEPASGDAVLEEFPTGESASEDEQDAEVEIWEPHTWHPGSNGSETQDSRSEEPADPVRETDIAAVLDPETGTGVAAGQTGPETGLPAGGSEDTEAEAVETQAEDFETKAAEAEPEAVAAEPEAAEAEPETPAVEPEAVAVESRITAATVAAVRAPSVQLPTLSVAPPPEPSVEPVRRLADPEQVLAAYPWVVDPATLRETADSPEQLMVVRDRLTDKLEYAERDSVRARLLSLRAVVSRVLGEYGRALADAREALRHAEAAGELAQVALVQARLAQVQHWRGDFADADRLYEEANSVELPDRLRAEMHVSAGRSGYEQGRYLEACNHFELALELRRVEDPELVARTEFALDAVMARVQESGWGPYPRSRAEILQQSQAPHPASDYETGFFGYADSNGDVVITEQFAEAQPFHEGAAWVRRPGVAAWELIDETGSSLIDRAAEYVHAGPFSDGLAWVSRVDGGWFAIDWHNRVIVPGGFDDVRPFQHGLAAVRKGGWGALDRHGRVVVPTRYSGFATVLTGSGSIDGFTEEGLATIDSEGLLGVVDRAGQVLVAPRHAKLVIHPAAFVIGDSSDRWGALNRRGEPLVDVVHESIGDVMRAIEQLSTDPRPVL